jgi:uncharacterized repeat protein (TIGR03803 family)
MLEQLEARNLLSVSDTVLHSFGTPDLTPTDGQQPWGSLTQVGSDLYGTTAAGGNGYGTIFEHPINDPLGYQVVWSFNGTDGSAPHHYSMQLFTFTLDGQQEQELIGATVAGGNGFTGDSSSGDGVIFAYNITMKSYSVIYEFNSTQEFTTPSGQAIYDGMDPHSPPVYDPATKLFYGMTALGGQVVGQPQGSGVGIIYEFNPIPVNGNYQYQPLYAFETADGTIANGAEPHGYLSVLNGVLYGMTRQGGTDVTLPDSYTGGGVIFSYNLKTNQYAVLHEFGSPTAPTDDGLNSDHGGLIYVDGLFYGLTTATTA